MLLGATVLLVLVLLGAIYRSPLIAVIPLVVVFAAYSRRAGADLPVREVGRDRQQQLDADPGRADVRGRHRLLPAAAVALPRGAAAPARTSTTRWRARSGASGPAILASGLTVALSMLVLLVADTRSISSLGPGRGDRGRVRAGRRPDAAAGAAHDRRPARLLAAAAAGRVRPATPRLELHRGVWRRFGDRVLQRPGLALGGDGRDLRRRRARPARLQGGLQHHERLQEADRERRRLPRARAGVPGRRLEPDHGAGRAHGRSGAPERRRGGQAAAEIAAAAWRPSAPAHRALARRPHRAARHRLPRRSLHRHGARTRARSCATACDDCAPGVRALLGGGTAVQYDFDKATAQRHEEDRAARAAGDRRDPRPSCCRRSSRRSS